MIFTSINKAAKTYHVCYYNRDKWKQRMVVYRTSIRNANFTYQSNAFGCLSGMFEQDQFNQLK